MNTNFYPDRQKLQKQYEKLFPSYIAALETIQARLRVELSGLGVHFTIKHRVKTFDSYYGKLLKRKADGKHTDDTIPIHDILGTRVVCPFLEDVERVEERLHKVFRIRETERKGAHTFREFGYSSTHLLLEIPENIRKHYPSLDLKVAELQVRTFLQDAWAEVEHELIYKNSNCITPLDDPLRRKLAALNANLSLSDDIFQEIRDYQRRLHCELNKRRYSFTAQLDEIKPGLTTAIAPAKNGTNGNDSAYNNGGNGNSAGNEMNNGAGGGMGDIYHGMSDINSNNKDQLLLSALNAHNEKNFPLAVDIYTKILEQEVPPYIRALVLIHRGKAYFSQSDYSAARKDFEVAAECEPENHRIFYHLGIVSRVMDDNASALKALKTCIEQNPFHVDALFALGRVYFDMDDYPGALEHCEKVLMVAPESASAKDFRQSIISRMQL